MRDLTLLVDTRDCAVHACLREADGPDGVCFEHRASPRRNPPRGVIRGVWCRVCEARTHPDARTGRCLWCDATLERSAT